MHRILALPPVSAVISAARLELKEVVFTAISKKKQVQKQFAKKRNASKSGKQK